MVILKVSVKPLIPEGWTMVQNMSTSVKHLIFFFLRDGKRGNSAGWIIQQTTSIFSLKMVPDGWNNSDF